MIIFLYKVYRCTCTSAAETSDNDDDLFAMHSYKEAEESEYISAVSVLLSAKQCDSSAAESAVTNDCLRRKWLSN